jgi:hypothetical protein
MPDAFCKSPLFVLPFSILCPFRGIMHRMLPCSTIADVAPLQAHASGQRSGRVNALPVLLRDRREAAQDGVVLAKK